MSFNCNFLYSFYFSRLFEELKGQHSTEKTKLTQESLKLKEQLVEIEQKLIQDRDKYSELKGNYQRQKETNM